jgi:hypothetical protein
VFELGSNYRNNNNSITGDTVIDICGKILTFTHEINYDNLIDYNVKFYNKKREIMLNISEAALKYAIFGQDINNNNYVSDSIIKYFENYWDMCHEFVTVIIFTNPAREGEAIWNFNLL